MPARAGVSGPQGAALPLKALRALALFLFRGVGIDAEQRLQSLSRLKRI